MKYLDSYAGTDDQKLDAALAAARSTNGYTDTIIFPNRLVTLTAQHTLQSGDQLSGEPGSADEPRGSGNKNRVKLTFAGSAFKLSGSSPHGIYIGNLSFEGTSSTIFLDGAPGQVLWTSVFENLGFSLFKHVLGSPTNKLLVTADTFKGFWNINNGYDRAMTLGGSDCNFFTEGCLIDSPPTTMSGTPTKFHALFDYLDKTNVGPVYITADQNSGLLVTGSSSLAGSSEGQLLVTGARIEGRNASTPAFGSVLRLEGGGTTFRDVWLSYGMSNPAATGRNDAGIVHIASGDHFFDAPWYRRASSVSESVPFIYVAAGARLRVRNVRAAGSWTGKPIVTGPGVINADDSVTVQ